MQSVLRNILTGIFVDTALQNGQEEKRRYLLQEVGLLFLEANKALGLFGPPSFCTLLCFRWLCCFVCFRSVFSFLLSCCCELPFPLSLSLDQTFSLDDRKPAFLVSGAFRKELSCVYLHQQSAERCDQDGFCSHSCIHCAPC